jgi:transposase
VDRDQQFLLPPDVRDWVPADHVVWTVLEVIEQVDTSVFHSCSQRGGVGRRGYDPDMLLTVLLLGYCTGARSSRQMERLCATDVGFRVACANDVPDHTVLARFRQTHAQAFEGLFTDVLTLAAVKGLVRLDTVAIDGTKIAANASMDANRDEAWVRQRAREILAEAAAVDAAEDQAYGDARGDEPDPEMTDPRRRAEAVRQWVEELAERDKAAEQGEQAQRSAQAVAERSAMLEAGQLPGGRHAGTAAQRVAQAERSWQVQRDRQQAKVDAYRQAKAAGTPVFGRVPVDPAEHKKVQRAKAAYDKAAAQAQTETDTRTGQADAGGPRIGTSRRQVNITDPASRIMKTRKGWVQGYNVQVAVSADQLIVACQVGQSTDRGQFVPMMNAVQQAADRLTTVTGDSAHEIGTVLADAGYNSHKNLTAEGPDRLIAQGKGRDLARRELAEQLPTPDASPAARMQHRLDTEAGRALYKRRGATVEPAIGNLKKLIDRFSQRGLTAVTAEAQLIAAAFNIRKIHRTALA